MGLKKTLLNVLYNKRNQQITKMFNKSHAREIESMCKTANITLHPVDGEEDFLTKWKPLMGNVNIDSYRFYSQFIGCDPNILPDDLFHAVIDPLINDKPSLPVYLNKNLYELLISKEAFPVCVIRNVNGDFLDKDYRDIQMNDKVFEDIIVNNQELIKQGRFIIKPTVETGRGKGVRLFTYQNGKWISNDGKEFSLEFINKEYFADYIIQECVEPSDFVKQFNPTSYSTCRIYTYRSVKDGSMHFLGGYLRIGDTGSFKDNIGSGGFAIPIMDDGSLAHFASNGTRNKYDEVNGVNLKDNTFYIPNFDKVLGLAFEGARRIPLDRVLSFDILLDKDNNPHIVEFNLKCQTITTMQTTYKTFFGEYTDEIIEYCLNKIKKGQLQTYSFYLKKS